MAVALATLLAASYARAHDFWIEPSKFRPAPGETVSIGLRVGQNFVGDPVPRLARAFEQFIVRQGGSEQPVNGMENTDPAGFFRADGQATAIVAYRSAGFFVDLPAEKFEEYLRQEGLEAIIEARTKRGERDKPGRERFYRYAKALVTGAQPSVAVSQPLGLGHEIVPHDDPTRQLAPFRGRVLHDGKPLPGTLVVAMHRADASLRLTARTDSHGAFSLDLPRAGVWLIKSVHMVRTSFWSFSEADWFSLWASLTFEVPEARP